MKIGFINTKLGQNINTVW